MKLSLIAASGILAISVAGSACAECNFPRAPESIPDGKTASEPAMVGAMAAFRQYNGEVDAYLTCLDSETDAKIKDTAAVGTILQLKAMQQKKRSSANDERQVKVNSFNEQVRTFKARKS